MTPKKLGVVSEIQLYSLANKLSVCFRNMTLELILAMAHGQAVPHLIPKLSSFSKHTLNCCLYTQVMIIATFEVTFMAILLKVIDPQIYSNFAVNR